MKSTAIALTTVLAIMMSAVAASAQLTDEMKEAGWVEIFDGKTLDGWKSNEKYPGFKVEDGTIVGFGNRNHLYYMQELKNFEVKMDVKISKGGNSGVYVKSQWQDEMWPVTGYELQVNASHSDPVKTGSLYNIIKLFKAPHGDDEWYNYHITCKGNNLEVRVNGELLYIYTDPMEAMPVPEKITEKNKRISQRGYIALQQHDPKSIPAFKNIYLKKLAD